MLFSRAVLRTGMLAVMLGPAPATTAAADLPRPVPATTFRLPDGSLIDLAKYRGKVVALEFLLTTCPHCQKCSALLQKMQQEYGPRGFQSIGVATNQMAHMLVNDYRRDFGLTYPVGFTSHETAVEWLQHPVMLTMYMPQLVFIDRNGMVRAQYPGTDKFFVDEETNMRKQIEALLNEPARGQGKAARPARKGS
jgi:thiol-disulfide isomerase/thioredoxin